mmetsp:Transcript_10507/g.17401  ORF Transcript_10507/g.17401 Transcript_10507/m.17401 type:complete len:206 (-) Transcript_10507:127-744(-)
MPSTHFLEHVALDHQTHPFLLAHTTFHRHRIRNVPIVSHLICQDANTTEDGKEAQPLSCPQRTKSSGREPLSSRYFVYQTQDEYARNFQVAQTFHSTVDAPRSRRKAATGLTQGVFRIEHNERGKSSRQAQHQLVILDGKKYVAGIVRTIGSRIRSIRRQSREERSRWRGLAGTTNRSKVTFTPGEWDGSTYDRCRCGTGLECRY